MERSQRLARRTLFTAGAPVSAAWLLGMRPSTATAEPPHDRFPLQPHQWVYDTVLYAHSDLDEVVQRVEASPALANATIDWGFGDWESALGAASHMGRRDIAEFLLEYGARPDLFTHAMLGHLDAVRRAIEALPGVQGTAGPHGITLLAHARAGGAEARPVVEYLEKLGDADPVRESQPLPLPAEAYPGHFDFEAGKSLELLERNGALAVKAPEGFPIRLVHTGSNRFHPWVSPSVRITLLAEGGQVQSLRIEDASLVLVGNRRGTP